jgi:hypothetical protein
MNASATHDPSGRRMPIVGLGIALSLFFAISFVLCILGYVLFPSLPITHSALSIFLPGFKLLSFGSAVLGLAESTAWGWYIAVVFAPLYNRFVVDGQR